MEKLSFYEKALVETINLNSEELNTYLKKELLFKYGNVTRADFNKKYSSEGWLGRKIVAIPAALWSGVVKTIVHLALSILIGIPGAIFSNGRWLKGYLFCIGRDFQESFGRLSSLFNDRFGLFYIQESRGQKNLYYNFLSGLIEKKHSDKQKTRPVETPPKEQMPKTATPNLGSTPDPRQIFFNFFNEEGSQYEECSDEIDPFELLYGSGFAARPKPAERNNYAVLELEKNATPDEIRAKYKELTRKYHPDKCRRNADETEADFQERAKTHTDRFAEIAQAYANLNNRAN